jgi:hypothetical protein
MHLDRTTVMTIDDYGRRVPTSREKQLFPMAFGVVGHILHTADGPSMPYWAAQKDYPRRTLGAGEAKNNGTVR